MSSEPENFTDIIEDDDEDVEGHHMIYNVDGPDDDGDVEGHRFVVQADGPDDDVEGHLVRM